MTVSTRPDAADRDDRDREWGKSGAGEMVSSGSERQREGSSVGKESLLDRGFGVFCCHGNLVVVLEVVGSNPIAHPKVSAAQNVS
jgi:hypothetical protein